MAQTPDVFSLIAIESPAGVSSKTTAFVKSQENISMIDQPMMSTGRDGVDMTSDSALSAPDQYLSPRKGLWLIVQLFLVSLLCSVGNGLITIAIPTITTDLSLDASLVVWPVLVYTLVSGTLLLLAGSIADVLGSRLINLSGVLALGLFTLATGFVKDGVQLVTTRAFAGAALAMFLPTAVSLVSLNIPSGRMRNMGFSFIGVGQAVGYALGLVIGGVLVDTAGWRLGYYLCGGCLLALFVSGLSILPHHRLPAGNVGILKRLSSEIDWAGVAMSSASLALLAYVLA